MTETQQTIAAYRKEQQRRQRIEDLTVTALITAIAAPVFAAIVYALIK
jgi:lipopolysaccharide/colanic/teichoic acid biosynthesis glycosyltransferase